MRCAPLVYYVCAIFIITLISPIQAQPQALLAQQDTNHSIYLPFVVQPLPQPNIKFESNEGGALTAFEVSGNYAYLGEGVSLKILDVSADSDPPVVGQAFIQDLGQIRDIAIVGTVAFVVSDFHFAAFSIANPVAPNLLSRVAIESANNIQIIGTKAYVGTKKQGIVVVDISNPRDLRLQADQTIPINASNLRSSGTLLFAFAFDNTTKLIDINTGAVLSSITPPTPNPPSRSYRHSDAIVRDGIAFLLHDERHSQAQVAVGTDPSRQIPKGFDVVDISNPSAPVLLRSFGLELPMNPSLSGFFLEGNTLYLNTGSDLSRYDISDPSNPIPLDTLIVNQALGEFVIANNRIYAFYFDQLFGASGYLHIIAFNPNAESGLPLIGKYTQQNLAGESSLQVIGDKLHSLNRIYDISTPTQLKLLGSMPIEPDVPEYYVISDTLRYVTANDFDKYHFSIYDQSDPSNIKLVASTIISGTFSYDIDIAGKYSFVASDLGLQVIDLGNQANPHLVGTIHNGTKVFQVEVEGSLAYLIDDQKKLTIYDISDPLNATAVGSITLPFAEAALLVQDGYAYAYATSEQGGGILAIDISQAASPTIVGHFANKDGSAERIVDLVINGSRIFALTSTGLSIYERSAQDFAQLVSEIPLLAESYSQANNNAIAYHNNYLYLYSYYLGTIVIRVD